MERLVLSQELNDSGFADRLDGAVRRRAERGRGRPLLVPLLGQLAYLVRIEDEFVFARQMVTYRGEGLFLGAPQRLVGNDQRIEILGLDERAGQNHGSEAANRPAVSP